MFIAYPPGASKVHVRPRLIRVPHHDLALDADLCSGGLCKLKPIERSVKLRRLSDGELSSSCECRVPQFGHRRIAPPEFARLELPLIFIFLLASSIPEIVTTSLSNRLNPKHRPDSLLHPPMGPTPPDCSSTGWI